MEKCHNCLDIDPGHCPVCPPVNPPPNWKNSKWAPALCDLCEQELVLQVGTGKWHHLDPKGCKFGWSDFKDYRLASDTDVKLGLHELNIIDRELELL